MAGSTYTPFMTEGMKGVRGALQGRRERGIEQAKKDLAERAYMGDPMATQELAGMDPELAMKVETNSARRKEATQQDTMAQDTAFKTDMERVIEQIGAFPDYQSAQRYGQQMTQIMAEKYPDRWQQSGIPTEFNEQAYKEIHTIANNTGKSGMTTVGSPYQVAHPKTGEPATAVLRDDGNGNVYEELMLGPDGSSLTRLSQYDVALKQKLAEAQATGAEEGRTTEERAQAAIDAGTAAAVTIPNLNRSLDIINNLMAADPSTAATAGWKQDLMALQQYVGYSGEDTADMAELQQLLAVQMFDTLSNFKGAISATELATAKQLSTGLGKNPEANKQILQAMQQRLARAVALGKKAASDRGDVVALEMLESFDPYAAAAYNKSDQALPTAAVATPAPPGALDYLKANPDQIDAFIEQFGYRPEGY